MIKEPENRADRVSVWARRYIAWRNARPLPKHAGRQTGQHRRRGKQRGQTKR